TPVNPGWRSERAPRSQARRAPRGFAASPQEAIIWLQGGGWRYVAAAAGALVLLLVLLLIFRGRGGGTALTPLAPTRVATNIANTDTAGAGLPVLQPTVTPEPLPSPPPLATNFVVAGTNGEGLFLRADHSAESEIFETLPDGTAVTRTGDDFTGTDRVWRKVRAPSGKEGWVAVDFLQAAP
ncbi:MAG: SH3 domain-containing protein, partial [Chloroflexales bacterium]|nr:SH3 domain-containing protein [Chloroflexales bacterium]